MTKQLSILELAKQGDATAIAALINRSLQPKGIIAQASLDRHCLSIVLLSTQIPNQKSVMELIHRGMMILQVELVKQVRITARKADSNVLVWESEFDLDTPTPSSLSVPTESSPILLDQNQKGVILVQKLSELNRNQQEYEDIIIRFTDERSGSVRCLSTLAELMQVINKSNFSFSTVATNPTLRNLLDTIAESSITDEKGDQVIGNVSVLQPGQPWQKVKIRLVTQVYFEPDVYEPKTTSQHGGITVDVNDTPVTSHVTASIASLPNSSSAQQNFERQEAATSRTQREFDKTSENLLDELIQDLASNSISIQDSKPVDIPEESLTVGEFLDDFGSDSKSTAKAGSTSSNYPEKTDSAIDDLFNEFEFLGGSSKASKSETDSVKYPDPPQIDPYKKEMITLDDFL